MSHGKGVWTGHGGQWVKPGDTVQIVRHERYSGEFGVFEGKHKRMGQARVHLTNLGRTIILPSFNLRRCEESEIPQVCQEVTDR